MGLQVDRIVVATDLVGHISDAILDSLQRHPDILIITGGLGPTYDDLTLDGLSSALQIPKACNRAAMEQVESKYKSLGLEMTPPRKKMAMMPAGATPILNARGSAPGVFIESSGTMIFCLPGVPCEMTEMFRSWVAKTIKERGEGGQFFEATLVVEGMPESSIASIIEEWLRGNRGIYLKSHPSGGEGRPTILIHFSITGNDRADLGRRLESGKKVFATMVKSHGGKVRKG
jgi:molybdopterin-biosynthesis enzyme MoeA-like protein